VIPGNDDALRAIRLFASKIADSIVEGAQAANDKQAAEFAGAAGATSGELPEGGTSASEDAGDSDAVSEEINLEEVLGGHIRKSPAVAAAAATETEAEAAVE
jgi:small subunit ribosomal protein S2